MSRDNSPLFVGSGKKPAIVFDSDSDTDSINTDSTAESEFRDEYEVERILMENLNQENCYLVKWEGYKLFRSTWEPPESLVGGETLAEWEKQKKRIAAGEAEPFNFDDYARVFSAAKAEKTSKRQRRNAKRQKRGLPPRIYSSEESAGEGVEDGEITEEAADDQNTSMTAASSKRQASPEESPKSIKRVKRPDVVRKGVAQKITRKRVVSETSSSDNDSSDDGTQSSTSADSLQEEFLARASAKPRRAEQASRPEPAHARKRSSASPVRKQPPKAAPLSASVAAPAPVPATKAPVATAKAPVLTTNAPAVKSVSSSATTTTAKSKATTTQAPHRAGPSGAARKSAPSHAAAGPAKKPHDVLARWDAPKQRRERQRVSGATPKDSSAPKFTALSTQGRYQKYGRENEKAPDFSALTFVDPKTGKTNPPVAPAQPMPTRELPSAYGRRTPPPQERRRSLTPPSPSRAPAVLGNYSAPARPICRFSITVGCHRSAQECRNVHPISKNPLNHSIDRKQVTCYWWFLRNSCANAPCPFAHEDTGIYSSPPGSGGHNFTVTLPPADAPPPPPPTTVAAKSAPPPPVTIATRSNSYPPDHPACRDWLEGHCPNPAELCAWAHAVPTEPFKGNIHAVPKRQLTCYWQSSKGYCLRKDTCAFAHVDTGVQAGPPGVGSAGRTSIVPGSRTGSLSNGSVSNHEALARNLSPIGLECFFWRTRGKCSKPDSECEYAHHRTGMWAAPPPGYDAGTKNASEVTNANMIPVAARRAMSSTTIDPAPVASEPMNANMIPVAARRGMSSTTIDHAPDDAGSPMELVRSPLQLQAPPMPPPGREESFRRPSISVSAGSLSTTLAVVFSGDTSPTNLQVKLELSELHIFGKLAGADLHLGVDRVVLASDFKTLVWDDQLRDSEFTVGSVSVSDVAVEQSLVNLCKQHTVGLVATQAGKQSRMLIYPPSDDVWKFLDTGTTWKTDSALRFRLFAELPDMEDNAISAPLQLESSSQRRPPAVLAGEELAKLDSMRMLPIRDKAMKDHRAVFIMFPPTHHAELEYYAKYFGGQNYRVYHSGVAGAWNFFCQSRDKKVLVVHPDVPLWQVLGLRDIIWAGTSIFSIGVNQLDSFDEPTFGCERLFPFAAAVLITDDVFVYHPDKALEILDSFITRSRAGKEYKLVTRPGVKEWLYRVAKDSAPERGRQDLRWLRVYDAICRLCPPEEEDPHDPPNPHPDTNLVSLSPELLPGYDALWEKNEVAATERLVEWFAGWTIENVGKLRKLYVLHEPKGGLPSNLDGDGRWVQNEDPRGWGKKYQHIWIKKPQDVFANK